MATTQHHCCLHPFTWSTCGAGKTLVTTELGWAAPSTLAEPPAPKMRCSCSSSCWCYLHSTVCTTCTESVALQAPSHPAGPFASCTCSLHSGEGDSAWHYSEEPIQEGDIAPWQTAVTLSPSLLDTLCSMGRINLSSFNYQKNGEFVSIIAVWQKCSDWF